MEEGRRLDRSSSDFDLAEFLDQQCAYYMAIGMSYEDFWYSDPRLVKYYRDAEVYRQQRQNAQAHLQGAYIYDLLMRVAPIFNPFNSKVEPQPYRENPFPITKEETELYQKREEERRYNEMRERMISDFERFNQQKESNERK